MRSNFNHARFALAKFFNTALVGSAMNGVKLSRASMQKVDITEVLLYRSEWEALQKRADVIGLPLLLNDVEGKQATTLVAA